LAAFAAVNAPLALLTAAAVEVQTPHKINSSRLDGLLVSVTSPTFRRAVAHFRPLATSVHSRFSEGTCVVAFAGLGLKIVLDRWEPLRGTPVTCTLFGGAVVTSGVWRTSRGLRVGSTVQTLRRLYPLAHSWGFHRKGGLLDPPDSTMWVVADETPGHVAHPILTADVRHGRLISLSVVVVGH
jgi:hypothetical protein